ncbi:MAG: homoserine dehydrogenase, partial [Propionibacteriaceae bacterium]|nr:homoserine dehydrogenase [Propionibacteriaceae bacterium]
VALIGFGGVNRALAEIIHHDGAGLAAELGFTLRVTAITDLRFGSLVNADGVGLSDVFAMAPGETFAGFPGGSETCSNEEVIRTVSADIIAEATFTNPADGEPALSHIRWALESGKSACTTNKGPVAFAGAELKALAAANGVHFEYEGAVMSGTPVIRLAHGPLAGAGITAFEGILNGTSNYILGRMEAGLDQAAAIKEAQELGFAEADPTADIGGGDVRLKVTILSNELLGARLSTGDVSVEGITGITPEAVAAATAGGKHWKLIGSGKLNADGSVSARVAPALLDAAHPLAGVSGSANAVTFDTKYLGKVTVSGPGAGRTETAYALLSDIIAIDAATKDRA